MASFVSSTLGLFKEAGQEWIEDEAPRLGAALAYYTVFSIAPLLVIVLAVVGMLWGQQSGGAQAELLAQVEGLLGADGADLIRTMLDNTSRPGSGGVLATVLGVAALLFGATGVFVQLQHALNKIWDVTPAPGGGIKNLLMARVLSFGMILGIGFLLLVSLVVSAVVSSLSTWLTDLSPSFQALAYVLNIGVSLLVITGLFAMIYRVLPDVDIAWRDVLVGAFITAVLFTLGKIGIGLYLGQSSAASTYGAAGSLVILLLWIYYSSLIIFFGAELTQVYARRYGSRIQPDEDAIRTADARLEAFKSDQNAAPTPAPIGPIAAAAPNRPARFRLVLTAVAAFLAGRWLSR